jgi:hypothetical protein
VRNAGLEVHPWPPPEHDSDQQKAALPATSTPPSLPKPQNAQPEAEAPQVSDIRDDEKPMAPQSIMFPLRIIDVDLLIIIV